MKIHKLVRDKIIEIIESRGEVSTHHFAESDHEFEQALFEKFQEELSEFLEAKDDAHAKEELADIFEVITAILAHKGWNLEDIVTLQKKKREARGGFEKRIILEMDAK
jgi:predicted house-cleaning noncanonical NTP pyrophosphatase (MazG superfamily)